MRCTPKEEVDWSWLSEVQACVFPPAGICHFVLEKLQTPHGGAGVHTKIPWWGLKIGYTRQMPHPGTTNRFF